ncbi:MAG: hypothetical protein GXP62_01420, partial [Oligoflexia bacterium]|nr:hypothetical protein [Oligoflexia bacterium]
DATETWYDDVDQDCDGWSDYDADRDHFDSSAWTGDDCDDADRLVHPYAYEDPSDGVDNDCDGATDSADRDTITTLSLADDDAEEITFDSVTIPFCGSDYTSAYVGSNGLLTFDYSSTSYSSSVAEMVGAGYPSIAGWWDDLNPASAGAVLWEEFDDAVAVYFLRVTEYGVTSNQTFSYLLLDDGSFILEFQNIDAQSGVVGWACGTGDTPDETDLTAENSSLPQGSFGIGSGTDDAVYEEFLGDADVAETTLAFCAQSGTDSDGDGWSDNCGDSDDTDATVFPE